MVTPGKNYPGQKGFPTPDTTPEEFGCRVFRFPNNDDWAGLLMGAIQSLESPYNYYQWGALTEVEAADAWRDFVAASFVEDCAVQAPTPYWDDTTDLDDQMPADEQIWYGTQNGSFVEDLGVWTIAGFLAYSGDIGAAITFLTLAPRFRLAWKTGNLGGIIRVIIDGADAGTVDTFAASDGVIERDFVGDPEETEHSILMVLEEVP